MLQQRVHGPGAQATDAIALVSAAQAQAESTHVEIESLMVIYESGKRGIAEGANQEQLPMPLSSVERIESIPLRQIEYAGGRAVLQ